MDATVYDVVVVGGGAAGLNAALVLGRARRRVVVVDAGAPRNAPAAHMRGFLSRDGIPPAELLAARRALRDTPRAPVAVASLAGGCPPPVRPTFVCTTRWMHDVRGHESGIGAEKSYHCLVIRGLDRGNRRKIYALVGAV